LSVATCISFLTSNTVLVGSQRRMMAVTDAITSTCMVGTSLLSAFLEGRGRAPPQALRSSVWRLPRLRILFKKLWSLKGAAREKNFWKSLRLFQKLLQQTVNLGPAEEKRFFGRPADHPRLQDFPASALRCVCTAVDRCLEYSPHVCISSKKNCVKKKCWSSNQEKTSKNNYGMSSCGPVDYSKHEMSVMF
jgi:hypothetical protein